MLQFGFSGGVGGGGDVVVMLRQVVGGVWICVHLDEDLAGMVVFGEIC